MQETHLEINKIKAFLPQIPTKDLEDFIQEIQQIIKKRTKPTKKQQELKLLEALSKTALPSEKLARFLELREKRQQAELPAEELKEFFQLIENEQDLQLKRILILGKLSKLKGISIKELANQLGIQPPKSV